MIPDVEYPPSSKIAEDFGCTVCSQPLAKEL